MLNALGARARSPLALAVTSTLAAALALWWLVEPDTHPFDASSGSVSVVALLPGPLPATFVLMAGMLGLAVAAALRSQARTPAQRQRLLVPAATVTVVLALSCMDTQLISFVGYVCAMTIPFVAIALLVAALRRSTAARTTAVVVVGLVAWWGAASGSLAPDAVGEMVRELGGGFARVGSRPWLLVGLALATVQWMAATLPLAAPLTARLRRPSARLDRVATVATVLAILSPLPYVAIRATWLVPDSLFTGPITPADLDPSMRLWGLMLGAAALGGAVLTLGLLRPWGRVFPAWMPSVGGRAVPVAAAAVPGYAVAFVLTASAPSIALMSVEQAADGDREALWMLLLLPFWLWGPALTVAVWGYVRRRRLDDRPAPQADLSPGRMAA
ncbi:hypothetical protein H4N58_19780 [Mumia sp. ZJ1417]|uniref:hypothetical protein n=1 Tax=Mumia sp. ZJ1417 TaxID=2708082 RepID=UPI00141D87C6|nr:hypothetical protein [Mumia sp. ZJ1417]QMW66339.1 hypothetical protein H4N58_19780 [Mumia sp. ZJ1417]